MKSHVKPFKCQYGDCGKGFELKSGLTAHVEDKHREMLTEVFLYFCPVEGCKESTQYDKGWPKGRISNAKRHMKSQHPGEARPFVEQIRSFQ